MFVSCSITVRSAELGQETAVCGSQSRTHFPPEGDMANARIVLTTIGSKELAEKLAQQLVERREAACVNIVGPIRSVYRWKERIENEEEYLLLIKTTTERAAHLQAAFEELHPYELPERLELAIEGGSDAYLAWLTAGIEAQ